MLIPNATVTVSARGARASSMREMNRASAGIVIHHNPIGGKAEYKARPAEAPINASPHTCANDTRCKISRCPMPTSPECQMVDQATIPRPMRSLAASARRARSLAGAAEAICPRQSITWRIQRTKSPA